jgi:hypothetical protein
MKYRMYFFQHLDDTYDFLASLASAGFGYYFTQYPPDLYHPVGHLLPSSLGGASLSELLIRVQ